MHAFPSESVQEWARRIGIPCSALTGQVIPSLEKLGYISRQNPTTFLITLENVRKNKKTKREKRDIVFEIEYLCKIFQKKWESRYKTVLTFGAREKYKLQDTIKKVGLPELERRIGLFFQNDWCMSKGGSLSLFLSMHSRLAGESNEGPKVCKSNEFDSEIQKFKSDLKGNAVPIGHGGIWS